MLIRKPRICLMVIPLCIFTSKSKVTLALGVKLGDKIINGKIFAILDYKWFNYCQDHYEAKEEKCVACADDFRFKVRRVRSSHHIYIFPCGVFKIYRFSKHCFKQKNNDIFVRNAH